MKKRTTDTTSRLITPALNRRQFLAGGMAGAASLSLRALATGLPLGFLLGGHMPAHAQSNGYKSLILAMSDDGESINAYAPGSYGTSSDDPRHNIDRATTAELGTATLGTVNGNAVSAADFEQSAMISLGNTQVEAARFWSYLPQNLLDQMALFHLRTAANGHPEGPNVHRVHGALMAPNGRGVEEIQSAIMQELVMADPGFNSVLSTPLVLNGGGGRLSTLTHESIAISRYSPLDIKNLFIGSNNAELENMNKVYDSTIDAIYKSVKNGGTAMQKRYLDAFASSRVQASVLGDRLGNLLDSITGSSKSDQARASVALAQAQLSPVIVIRYAYSGDNHNDADLLEEANFTIEQLNNLTTIWNLIQDQGLTDRINYATYDIFGRTLGRNDNGGRDHHNSSCINMMFGSNIKAGVVGGLEEWPNSGHRLMRATGVNSETGLTTNADISRDDTLVAYCRTLMASVGVSEERINVRLPSGKTIAGALI